MQETLWGDVLWLWGDTWFRHGLFLFGVVCAVGAIAQGWTQADNAIRINKMLRRDEATKTARKGDPK
jgi:hypothetical protein